MAGVAVMLLGPPRVERDGTAVAFDTRKALALLAVLALTDRPRPRDVLADLLWPEHDAEHARGALRRTLSTLRSAIGPESLEATRDRVSLVRGPGIEVDVDRFRALAAEGRAEQAVVCCWTGTGASIAANKVPGIRAASATDRESARLSREHNDANVLALGERLTPAATAREIVATFLDTPFAGGRHQRRIDKITALDRRSPG